MSSVKLEVGAWYFANIEPGDRVKPKPAGDKCWGVLPQEYIEWVFRWFGDGLKVNHLSVHTWNSHEHDVAAGDNTGYVPLSCLILLEKGAKAPAQDFQEGDEIEYTAGDLKGTHRMLGPKIWSDTWEVLRADGSSAGVCSEATMKKVASRIPTHDTPKAAPKLNPRVLPSVSGSELLWPDVKRGIELDKLPMDKSTNEDQRGDFKSHCVLNDAQSILGVTKAVLKNLGYANNSDRERIRKIIPEIRKKLATLEGKL